MPAIPHRECDGESFSYGNRSEGTTHWGLPVLAERPSRFSTGPLHARKMGKLGRLCRAPSRFPYRSRAGGNQTLFALRLHQPSHDRASLPSEITDPKEASFRLSPGMPLFYRKAANWKKHFHNFEVAFKIFKYNLNNLNFKKILPILKIKIIQQSCKI